MKRPALSSNLSHGVLMMIWYVETLFGDSRPWRSRLGAFAGSDRSHEIVMTGKLNTILHYPGWKLLVYLGKKEDECCFGFMALNSYEFLMVKRKKVVNESCSIINTLCRLVSKQVAFLYFEAFQCKKSRWFFCLHSVAVQKSMIYCKGNSLGLTRHYVVGWPEQIHCSNLPAGWF